MQVKRSAWVVVVVGVVACGTGHTPPSGASDGGGEASPARPTTTCAPGTKSCGGTCASTLEPETGCAGPTCDPCRIPHASASCAATTCSMGTCENTWGNCNDSVSDGCETSLATASAHCGACGKACRADEVCSSSTCVPKARADAESWLANETEGYCLDEYNKMLNLCGDVEFCFDPRFMRKYPTGVAMDLSLIHI